MYDSGQSGRHSRASTLDISDTSMEAPGWARTGNRPTHFHPNQLFTRLFPEDGNKGGGSTILPCKKLPATSFSSPA